MHVQSERDKELEEKELKDRNNTQVEKAAKFTNFERIVDKIMTRMSKTFIFYALKAIKEKVIFIS